MRSINYCQLLLNHQNLFRLVGENPENLEDIVDSIEERWAQVNDILDERRANVKALGNIHKLRCEAEAMSRVLESHQKFFLCHDTSPLR